MRQTKARREAIHATEAGKAGRKLDGFGSFRFITYIDVYLRLEGKSSQKKAERGTPGQAEPAFNMDK